MKFRFCGDLDCPDWVLAEIATISKMSSIKAKQLCALTVNALLNGENLQNEKLEKLATDTKLEINDIRASISLIEFIMKSSTKHVTNSETLSSELQQLGLPKEHATSMSRVYEENQVKLEELLQKSSLRINNLLDHSWRVDFSFGSSYLNNLNETTAHIHLKLNNVEARRVESNIISLDKNKLKLLIHELKEARTLMRSLNESEMKTS